MFATLYGKVLIGCLTALTVISFIAALTNRRTDDNYTSVMMIALAYGLVEIIWFCCSTDLVTFSDNVVKLVGSVRILFIVILGYMPANYFLTLCGRKLDIKILIFILIQVIILLDVNIFYMLLFDYSAATGLTRGSLWPAPYVIFALCGALLVIMVLSGKQKAALPLVSGILMLISGIVQVFTEKLPVIYLAFSIILLTATLALPKRGTKPVVSEEEEAEEAEADENLLTEQQEILESEPVYQQPLEETAEPLPEYTFDSIDEALQDDGMAEQPQAEPQPVEETVISDEAFIEDFPELKQIEELIESETATDMPAVEEPQPQISGGEDIEDILNQISESVVTEEPEERPELSEEIQNALEETQATIEENQNFLESIHPSLEDTQTSLAAIQQAYDQEIEADREKEKARQEHQRRHNETIISKPVISPLGPIERPKPVAKPAVKPIREITAISGVGVAEVSADTMSYAKPLAVEKLPVEEVITTAPFVETVQPYSGERRNQAKNTLPSLQDIIVASQIAHGKPEEETAPVVSELPVEQPAAEENYERKPVKPYRPRRRKSYRIMIIGSMSSEVRTISDALKKEKGYRIDVIDDGYLAMELLAGPFAKVFDAIIAVDQPSYSDVFTTVRMIRDCDVREIASLPIICLINDDPRRNITIQNSGVDVFVNRPLSVDDLSAVLREQLENHGW